MIKSRQILLLLLLLCASVSKAQLPTMGWSSWNTYGVNISDTLIMSQAKAMAESGLHDAGYTYVNIDDGYFGGRAKNGRLLIHPVRFKGGLKPVVDYIHSLGLKAGIYSDAGRNTCGSFWNKDTIAIGVGLFEHDVEDCRMFFSEMGFDFIKVDFCGGDDKQNFGHLLLDEQDRYTSIRKAINMTGRSDIRFNVCRWDYPGNWVSSVADSWRISHDIADNWNSVKDIISQSLYLSAYSSKGHYNDMDMLEVGRRMSREEDHTHFGMWCIMASPLLIGCDLTSLKPETLRLLTDRELIALNQDPLGLQAYVAKRWGSCYALVKDIKTLHGYERALALYNSGDDPADVSIKSEEIEMGGKVRFHEIGGSAVDVETDNLDARIPAHGLRIYTVECTDRLERKSYEAETAYLSRYQELWNNQDRKTAIYEEDERCSGGMKASWLGFGKDNDIIWPDVYVAKDGERTLEFDVIGNEPSDIYVEVNGNLVMEMKVQGTGNIEHLILKSNLGKGSNKVRLYCPDGRMADVDVLKVY